MPAIYPLKAILFDLDGTLINSQPAYVAAFQQTISEFTGRVISSAELSSHIGTPSPRILAHYAPPDRIAAMTARNNELMNRYSDRITFYPGARNALQDLRASGFKIGVATSQLATELVFTRDVLQMDELVDVWVNSDMVAHPKPAPDPLLLALEQLGELPQAAVMVGDTTNDLRAGQAAGTRIAAVTWGFGRLPDLLDCAPDLVLNQPAELSDLPALLQPLFSSPIPKR